LQVTLVGDLKYGRTVHSLSVLLSRFDGVTLNLVAPPELRLPSEWLHTIRQANPSMRLVEVDEYHDVVDRTDVLYMTRVQRERFESAAAYEAVKGRYVLTASDLANAKAVVLHPLPRVDEISTCVDSLPNAKYFEQVGYGVVMRSALLCLALGAA
jgi:aspartate carbamoyltransferase catalytic subunit